MESYTTTQGTALAIQVALEDSRGTAAVYAGTETLSATVQAGLNQPSLCTPTTAWLVAADGTLTVRLSAVQTAALVPGIYVMRVRLKVGSADPDQVYECSVLIEAGPGATVTLPTYTTYQRLIELAPWVDLCFNPKVHLTGFLREQATAREYFDGLVLRLCRSGTWDGQGLLRSSIMDGFGLRRSALPSTTIKGYLDTDKLLVTPQVDRINAWLAIAEIGRQQIGLNNAYAALGSAAASIASSEISVCTAQIDLNGDGLGEIAIPLNAANHLFT